MDKSKTLKRATLGGSVVAGIAASLCCLGPLVALALGLGGFAGAAVFAKWRPLLLGVTFVMLALAWYLTFSKPKTACQDGPLCTIKPSPKWNKLVLWFSTVVVLIAASFPNLSSAILQATQRGAPSALSIGNSAVLKVQVLGMDCAACALRVQSLLKTQSGVQQAQVSFATKEAVVQYDATRSSPEKIIAAIERTGFKAEPANRKESE